MGGQISWLLPAALLLLVALLWVAPKAPRTDRTRAFVILWGGWLLVTGLVFSFSQGIIHPYYTVALAPAIAALVGVGVVVFWRQREQLDSRLILAATVAITALWSFSLLSDAADWQPWLRYAVLVAGVIAVAALVTTHKMTRWLVIGGAIVALLTLVGGSAGYAVQTAATAHTGAIPSAGPAGAGRGGGQFRRPPGAGTNGNPPAGSGTAPGSAGPAGGRQIGGGTGPRMIFGGGPGGGLLDAGAPPAAVTALLKQNSSSYTWAAAVVMSNSAAGYQLATGLPVMAVGGFNGTDPAPTLAQFQAAVAAHKIHYFIGGSSGGFGSRGGASSGGSNAAQLIAAWVAQHYKAESVGGVTLYDLS
jgi:4-amino-4-deoxy-L-arabinose transferase-like glycosyltransferase